jgi:hypothetical protein
LGGPGQEEQEFPHHRADDGDAFLPGFLLQLEKEFVPGRNEFPEVSFQIGNHSAHGWVSFLVKISIIAAFPRGGKLILVQASKFNHKIRWVWVGLLLGVLSLYLIIFVGWASRPPYGTKLALREKCLTITGTDFRAKKDGIDALAGVCHYCRSPLFSFYPGRLLRQIICGFGKAAPLVP